MTGRKRGRPPKETEVTLETAPTKVTKLSSVPENNRGSPSPPPLENGSAEEKPGALQSVSPQTTPAYQQREEEREEERDPLVTSPPERDLVIYCGNCNTILGDTSTFICTHAKAKTLTLGGATMVTVKRGEEVEIEKSGFMLGCSFYRLFCNGCSQPVGKVFCSTTRELDLLRDCFTFEQHAIKSYELGSGMELGAAAKGQQAAPSGTLVDRLDVLETQMLKVENLMLLFNERIEGLEANVHTTSL